jgi:Flp pilus assembly protein TadG
MWVRASERRFESDDRGSALIETAICSGVFLTLLFGLMGFSMALYAEHAVAAAAQDAARYAMVRGSSWEGSPCASNTTPTCEATAADVTAFVRGYAAPSITAANLSVSTTWTGKTGSGAACDAVDGANSPGCVVQVTVSYPFNFLLPVPQTIKLRFSATSAVVITH